MKKLKKPIVIYFLGMLLGYYICSIGYIKNLFNSTYKAFQVGVYTNLETANAYKNKFKNSIVIEDDELYRVFVAILKREENIRSMESYLNKNNISYYIKDIDINDVNLKREIDEYESIMNKENEVVFLELNKMIIKLYGDSL